jgi:hypothetical protein
LHGEDRSAYAASDADAERATQRADILALTERE